MLFAPALSALVVLVFGTMLGIGRVRKLITVLESKHELRQGSASFLRGVSGWIVIAIWIAAVWFVGSVIGDWGATGDLTGALERAQLRLLILIEILAALGDQG